MIKSENDFEVLAPVVLNVICFRYRPEGFNESRLNEINEKLNHHLNDSGKMYLTHTVLNGRYTLRMVTGQTNVTLEHVEKAWEIIKAEARGLV
jgi:aromatic-L-amino-acid decarboxylase